MKLSFLFAAASLLVTLMGGISRSDVFVGSGFALVDGGASAGVASGDIVIAGDGRSVTSVNSVTLSNLILDKGNHSSKWGKQSRSLFYLKNES
jgi:hypothetical protein